MNDIIKNTTKAFHDARIVGEQLLEEKKISWEDFQFTMIGFELQLRSLGVDL